jgi:hypothetical protein
MLVQGIAREVSMMSMLRWKVRPERRREDFKTLAGRTARGAEARAIGRERFA